MGPPTADTARENAFLAALSSGFLEDHLHQPLAREIATGAEKKTLLLDEIGKRVVSHLPKKKKEKILFRQTLYQIYFLKSLPLYSILDEAQKIAKKHIHPSFAKFLNGALRHLDSREVPYFPEIPIRFSMPKFFVDQLIKERGEKECIAILEAFEAPLRLFARKKGGIEFIELQPGGNALGNDLYIQNRTPALLFSHLKGSLSQSPHLILDMASAPGGKLLLAADLFPDAKLFANDVSEKKLSLIRENLKRFGKEAVLSCSRGEDLPMDPLFDLIILDAPCSNTGVLHKRSQARWRLTPEAIREAKEKQIVLLKKALSLVKKGGAVFYMTCSLLKEENEEVVAPFHPNFQETILPNLEGLDGGFGACIIPS